MDPSYCHTLIEESQILRSFGGARKAEDVHAEVEGHYHDILSIGKILTIIERCVAGTS